jgi:hypothetical protein
VFLLAAVATHEDVVIAELGASAAFVGFVLVFVGIVLGSYQTLRGQLSLDKLAPFKRAAWLGLGIFLFGLVSIALSASWLIAGGGRSFYIATLVLFFIELAGLVIVADAARRVLLK